MIYWWSVRSFTKNSVLNTPYQEAWVRRVSSQWQTSYTHRFDYKWKYFVHRYSLHFIARKYIHLTMKQLNQKLIICLLFGLLVQQHQVDAFLGMVLSLAQFAWSAFEMFNTAHDAYSKFTTPSTQDILDKTEEIAESVEKWGTRLEAQIENSMNTLLTRLPLLSELVDDIRILNRNVGRIDAFFQEMIEYREDPEDFSTRGLRKLIKSFTGFDDDDVQGMVIQLHGLIVPSKLGDLKKSLPLLVALETREHGLEICGTGSSPQQRVIELVNIIIESEMRAITLMGFGLLMEDYLDGIVSDDSTGDMKRARKKLVARAKQYALVLKATLSIAARQFRQCDPADGHIRDETFFEFVRFKQILIVAEAVLPEDNLCKESCTGYTQPTPMHYGCDGIECEESDFSCHGSLSECGSMKRWATISEFRYAKKSRRYIWFRAGDGVLSGVKKSDNQASEFGEDSTEYKGYACDICRCLCTEDDIDSKATHFISLREQITNVNDNMVVVGLRLVIVNKILHIAVMQGVLEIGGIIYENKTSWIEPENIVYDPSKSTKSESKFIKRSESGDVEELNENDDVAVLTYASNSIALDTISVPENHVMTGITFRRGLENAIELGVHATKFDPATATLDPDSGTWFSRSDMPYSGNKRYKKELLGLDNPINSKKTDIDSVPNTYIELHASGNVEDAGQTTVPLVDGIPVISTPLIPYGGVGLYHKAEATYSGFLTLVVEGSDLSAFIPADP